MSDVSQSPKGLNPLRHVYDGEAVDGYAVCALCGAIERALAGGLNCRAKVLEEYQYAAAEFAGTNSAVDDGRKAGLFMKHRAVAQELQRKHTKSKEQVGNE